MTVTADIGTASLAAWSELVRVLPTPAALIDPDGRVITSSRWTEQEAGTQLVDMATAKNGIAKGTDGTTRWRVRPIRKGDPTLLATIERLGAADHMLRRFFAGTDKLFVVYDQAGRAIEWNSAWQTILGYTDDDMLGLDAWALLPTEARELQAVVEQDLRKRGRSEPSWRMRDKDGGYHLVQWVLLYDPTVGRCFGVGHDMTGEQRQIREQARSEVPREDTTLSDRQDELHRRAYTDDLTGLASRTRTVAELDRHLRNDGEPAVLFCDLDQFKVVNDSLGHAVGDRLLAALGKRLSSTLDSDEIMVGRLGGDEFAVVIGDGGRAAAEAAAAQAFEAVSREFSVVGRSVKVGMSVGICVASPGEQLSAEMMFERADMAVYQAKEDGRGRSVFYGPELQLRVDRRFELEAALRRGLELGEFEPWFQPVVDIHTVQIVGVEALLRWRRGDGVTLAPDSFLDVAMETGLITPIGRQMIDLALTEFGSMGRLGENIWLTLNVSARELANDVFTEWFVDRVGAAGLRPSQIVIEITESVAIEEHQLSEKLTVLRALGFRIALDDFGTGHSSLAHLRTLPIDVVKIDRSFVHDLVADHTTRALTSSVVALCEALGLEVIFEGVESKAEAEAVVRAGGTLAQGYLYSTPMPVSDLQWRTVGAALSARLAARKQIDSTENRR